MFGCFFFYVRSVKECEIATAEEEEGWEGETTTFWRFSTAKPFLVPILFTLVG